MKRRNLTAMAGVLLMAGWGVAGSAAAAPGPSVIRAQAAAAEISTCEQDGRPATASLAPAGITTNPSTWPDGSTMDRIRREKRITVGVSGDAVLWGSSNPRTGDLEGFDIDVLTRIAQEIAGPKVEIDYKVITYANRLPALINGDVDLVAHTMTINCDRWFGGESTKGQFINFSSEYYRAGQKLLVRADSEARSVADLGPDDKICVTAGSTNIANLAKLGVDDPVEVSDQGECLVKFQEGEVAAITADDTVLAGFSDQDPYALVVGNRLSEEPYGVGIAPKDTVFTRYVNAVLEEMRTDGSLRALYNKHMAPNVVGAAPAVPEAEYGRDLSDR